jgi:hypothetical protein
MKAAALFFMSLCVALLSGCAAGPRPAPGTASLRVHVVAEPKEGRKITVAPVSTYDTPAPVKKEEGQFELVDYSNLGNIVVWLEPASGSAPSVPPPGDVTIEVDPNRPATQLSGVISVGQRLIVRNSGSRTQGIYSVSDGNDFDLGKLAPGQQGSYVVKSAGPIEILGEAVAQPVATVFAAPSPWRAMTHSHGNVEFNNVPPGHYRLVSWHPRLPGTEQIIDLSADQSAAATITVGVNSLPKVSR